MTRKPSFQRKDAKPPSRKGNHKRTGTRERPLMHSHAGAWERSECPSKVFPLFFFASLPLCVSALNLGYLSFPRSSVGMQQGTLLRPGSSARGNAGENRENPREKKPAGSGFLRFYFPMFGGMADMSALICCAVGLVESNWRYLVQISRALSGCFRSDM